MLLGADSIEASRTFAVRGIRERGFGSRGREIAGKGSPIRRIEFVIACSGAGEIAEHNSGFDAGACVPVRARRFTEPPLANQRLRLFVATTHGPVRIAGKATWPELLKVSVPLKLWNVTPGNPGAGLAKRTNSCVAPGAPVQIPAVAKFVKICGTSFH
jgi:hypothetical protein